ncbi:MAG: hypothetical protein IKA28_05185 [Tidjanibacter sp.]|nr:hypothetical protein [Tidjanibacter sp.]
MKKHIQNGTEQRAVRVVYNALADLRQRATVRENKSHSAATHKNVMVMMIAKNIPQR